MRMMISPLVWPTPLLCSPSGRSAPGSSSSPQTPPRISLGSVDQRPLSPPCLVLFTEGAETLTKRARLPCVLSRLWTTGSSSLHQPETLWWLYRTELSGNEETGTQFKRSAIQFQEVRRLKTIYNRNAFCPKKTN